MSNNTKIVLTGANGFLGSHLVDRLLAEHADVHCIVRKSSNLQWLKGKNVKLHTCGLNDVNALAEVFKSVDYIFHLAGSVSGFSYEDYLEGNVKITQNVLEALKLSGAKAKKVVVTSSQAVSGPSATNTLTEASNNPISFYGKSKLAQEALCATYFDLFPICIARPSIIYGPRDTEFFEFIKTVNTGFVPLVGRDDKSISSIYVDDLIEGLYQMALSENTKSKIYHLASKEVLTWKDLGVISAQLLSKKPLYLGLPHWVIKAAGALSGWAGKLKNKPATFDSEKAKEGVQVGWVCSVERAKKDFNFEAKISAEEGLSRTIAWYKENKWL